MRPVRGGRQPFGIGLFERLLLPGIVPLHGSVDRGGEQWRCGFAVLDCGAGVDPDASEPAPAKLSRATIRRISRPITFRVCHSSNKWLG